MRTLSIRQPWAWLIVQGIKPVENRSWSTDYRGEFLIHAGAGLVQRDYRETAAQLRDLLGIELPDMHDLQMHRGGIVGIVELVDVVTHHDSPFFTGEFGFVLANARPLPFVPWKGQLGWFDVPRAAVGLEPITCAA